jgi:hypothetical protein
MTNKLNHSFGNLKYAPACASLIEQNDFDFPTASLVSSSAPSLVFDANETNEAAEPTLRVCICTAEYTGVSQDVPGARKRFCEDPRGESCAVEER